MRVLSAGQCWFLRGGLDDVRLEWLVDTGAVPNLLDTAAYEAISDTARKPLLETNVHLFGANGGPLTVHGWTEVVLVVEGRRYELPVIVADLEGLQGILGINFLEDNDCSINVKRGYLDCGVYRHQLYRLRAEGCQRVCLTEALVVAAGETVEVKASLEGSVLAQGPCEAAYEPDEDFMAETGLLTSTDSVQVGPGRQVSIRYVNVGGDSVELLPGTTLGVASVENGQCFRMNMIRVQETPPVTTELQRCCPGKDTSQATRNERSYDLEVCREVAGPLSNAPVLEATRPGQKQCIGKVKMPAGVTAASNSGKLSSVKSDRGWTTPGGMTTEDEDSEHGECDLAELEMSDWEVDDKSVKPEQVTPGTVPEHLKDLVKSAVMEVSTEDGAKVQEQILQNIDLFVGPGVPLGRTTLVEHRIHTGDARPIKQRARRLAWSQEEIVNSEVEKMLEADIIEVSDSPWSSPVVLAKKKDGTPRFCVDMRRLNEVTVKDSYPLPVIQDCLDALAGGQWFCTLDLASGYWQVPVAIDDRPKTAFVTKRGLYQYKVMPFGLTNAPATFERLMERALQGLQWESCIIYLDDCIAWGRTLSLAQANLQKVLDRLRQAGLRLKPSKCDLFRRQVAFLGHIVSAEGVSCDPGKIEAVREWPVPTNITEVRSFLGLANYYRKYVESFASVAAPLTRLTEKGVEFVWDAACEESFAELRQRLTCSPILAYPDPCKEFLLDTDASGYGLGCVLSQLHDGEERVVAYASKALNKSQRNYCTTYRELLAVVVFTQHFRCYLLGRHFRLRTDHASLRWLMGFKEVEGMVGRWLAKLSPYDFTVEHRAGAAHGNADGLSRRKPARRRRCRRTDCPECVPQLGKPLDNTPAPDSINNETPEAMCNAVAQPESPIVQNEYTVAMLMETESEKMESETEFITEVAPAEPGWLEIWTPETVQRMQEADPEVATVKEWIEDGRSRPRRDELLAHGSAVRSLCTVWGSLGVKDGVLCRWSEDKQRPTQGPRPRMVAPSELRREILQQLHSCRAGGHLGITKTLEKTRSRFYWPDMRADVERWCRECDNCAQVKPGPGYKARLTQVPVAAPLDRVGIDVVGELPESNNGNRYIIVISDYFTKWVQAHAVADQTAQTTAEIFVREFVANLGVPRHVHTDQGRNFESELFAEVCRLLAVHKTRTTPYLPRSDGLVERFNRTLQQMLKALVNENRTDWDELLPYVLMAYRSSPQESTGCSPYMLMYGKEMALPVDVMVGVPGPQSAAYRCPVEYVEWLRQSLQEAHEFARQRLQVAARRQKNQYDARSKPHKYNVGDYVWYYYPPLANKKLGKGWVGVYRVMEVTGSCSCVIQLTPDGRPKRVHCDHLKPHLGQPPSAWAEQETMGSRTYPSGSDNVFTSGAGSVSDESSANRYELCSSSAASDNDSDLSGQHAVSSERQRSGTKENSAQEIANNVKTSPSGIPSIDRTNRRVRTNRRERRLPRRFADYAM